MGKEAC